VTTTGTARPAPAFNETGTPAAGPARGTVRPHPDPPVPAYLREPWQLFTDWCAATGRAALPTTAPTVTTFLTQLPASPAVQSRRLRAIRAAHAVAANADPAPPEPKAWSTVGERYRGAGWADPAAVLVDLAGTAYPAGVAARRDALIVLLCVVRGRTRRQALTAHAETWPVPSLDGADLRYTPDPATCHACVMTRWLRLLAADATGGRHLVEDTIEDADLSQHDCRDEVPPGWANRSLLPAVDQHAWIGTHTPLSPRAVSGILRRRLCLAQVDHRLGRGEPRAADVSDGVLSPGHRDLLATAELDELLAHLEREIDRALSRSHTANTDARTPKA